jgi:phosphohistidine phosphatase
MKTTVYLVQHGKAKDKEDDPARPLTVQGRRETERIAELAARLDLGIEEIRHSGKTRAEETAVIFGRALGVSESVTAITGLHPTDDVKPVANRLASTTNPVMLVGHLPFMPRLAGQLVHGDAEKSPVEFRKSGIVCVVREADGWRVDWQLNPGPGDG